jgi:hypothetical protein
MKNAQSIASSLVMFRYGRRIPVAAEEFVSRHTKNFGMFAGLGVVVVTFLLTVVVTLGLRVVVAEVFLVVVFFDVVVTFIFGVIFDVVVAFLLGVVGIIFIVVSTFDDVVFGFTVHVAFVLDVVDLDVDC